MAREGIRLPGRDKRLAIVGSTGSGKTVAGAWHLSMTNFDERPLYVLDYKRDKLLRQLNMRELSLDARPPQEPGVYVFRPVPSRDDAKVIDLLWKIWSQEESILYTDEGYMVGARNPAFNALLTQGRSKNIQMITLSQRPAWMSRFVFSEADFFQCFRLNDIRDYDTIQQMISVDIRSRLPSYHSRWYDVGEDAGATFLPVPKFPIIRDEINRRIRRLNRVI